MYTSYLKISLWFAFLTSTCLQAQTSIYSGTIGEDTVQMTLTLQEDGYLYGAYVDNDQLPIRVSGTVERSVLELFVGDGHGLRRATMYFYQYDTQVDSLNGLWDCFVKDDQFDISLKKDLQFDAYDETKIKDLEILQRFETANEYFTLTVDKKPKEVALVTALNIYEKGSGALLQKVWFKPICYSHDMLAFEEDIINGSKHIVLTEADYGQHIRTYIITEDNGKYEPYDLDVFHAKLEIYTTQQDEEQQTYIAKDVYFNTRLTSTTETETTLKACSLYGRIWDEKSRPKTFFMASWDGMTTSSLPVYDNGLQHDEKHNVYITVPDTISILPKGIIPGRYDFEMILVSPGHKNVFSNKITFVLPEEIPFSASHYMNLEGNINDKVDCTIDLILDEEKGRDDEIYYGHLTKSDGQKIFIKGGYDIQQMNLLRLEEYEHDTALTGILEGIYDQGEYNGYWISTDGGTKVPFVFRDLVAQPQKKVDFETFNAVIEKEKNKDEIIPFEYFVVHREDMKKLMRFKEATESHDWYSFILHCSTENYLTQKEIGFPERQYIYEILQLWSNKLNYDNYNETIDYVLNHISTMTLESYSKHGESSFTIFGHVTLLDGSTLEIEFYYSPQFGVYGAVG